MAPIRSKLMELSYSDPKFQIRLTGYADTVIIDSGVQQTISAIRFGGYPEVVRALSDAIYGGASMELKQGDTTLRSPPSCWRTSLPETWTAVPVRRSWSCCVRSSGRGTPPSSSAPMTRRCSVIRIVPSISATE